jgi:hypothetical protein
VAQVMKMKIFDARSLERDAQPVLRFMSAHLRRINSPFRGVGARALEDPLGEKCLQRATPSGSVSRDRDSFELLRSSARWLGSLREVECARVEVDFGRDVPGHSADQIRSANHALGPKEPLTATRVHECSPLGLRDSRMGKTARASKPSSSKIMHVSQGSRSIGYAHVASRASQKSSIQRRRLREIHTALAVSVGEPAGENIL